MTRGVTTALIAMLACAAGVAQEPPPASVEARLRRLEARAARADALELQVADLKRRLARAEDEGREAESAAILETHLSRWIQRDDLERDVRARGARDLVIGGQMRLRSEYRTVSRYDAASPRDTDEDFVIQRTRVNFDARLHEYLRVFVEIQDSRQWGEANTTLTDLEGVDLYQGFIDFENAFGSPFTVRAGRFTMTLWNQRLISSLDWHPVGRSWDGVLVFGDVDDWSLIAGYQTLAEDPLIDSDQDDDFYWGAATYNGFEGHELGAAFFWLHRDAKGADASFGTLTLHGAGRLGQFDYSLDGAYQFGSMQSRSSEAFAAAVTLGYTFECDYSPRVGLEWTYATGDDADTSKVETFDPLFTFAHAYQGFLDIFAWKNSHDFVLHASMKPAEDWWVGVAFHAFFLDETDDAWYGASGRPIRIFPATSSDELGYELDITAKVRVNEVVNLWFGYSHFFAGDFVEASGASPDTDWVFLQLTVNF